MHDTKKMSEIFNNLSMVGALYMANFAGAPVLIKTKALNKLCIAGKATYDKQLGYRLTPEAVIHYVNNETEGLR